LSLSSHRASLPNYRLQGDRLLVLVQSRLVMASECINTLARSRAPSASPNSLDYGLQVHHQTHLITAFKCISELTPFRPPGSHNHGLQVHLQTSSITASKWISKLAKLQPASVRPNWLDYGRRVHIQVHSITVCWNGEARRQKAQHQHSAAPCMVSEGNSWQRSFVARGVSEESDRISRDTWPRWATQIVWIYESSAILHETQSSEEYSVYFIQWDDVYLPRGLPMIYCVSLSPSPLSLYLRMYVRRET